MPKKQNGYILILTLMILSILVILVTGLFYNSTGHQVLSRTLINREKAKMLALSGIQLARSKLSASPKKEDSKVAKDDQKKREDIFFLTKILPSLNRWETLNLKEEVDGVDGQIKLSISCENGKININKIYDFSKHKFIMEGVMNVQKIFEDLNKRIRPLIDGKDFLKGLLDFLQKRKFPLNDVTELLLIPEFSYFQSHVFYEPPSKKEDVEKWPIFLTDIFTTWTDKLQMQPWLFSDSVIAILGLRRADVNIGQREKSFEQLFKAFKTNAQWAVDWNKILKPLFERDFTSLPKGIELMLDSGFDPNVFSVLSYGTVGEITERIFAILQKQIVDNQATYEVKKLYWI